jgi:hypothetical protein
MFRRRRPVPPRNVRVELGDGRVVPCELVYAGFAEGVHQWRVVTPVAISDGEGGAVLRADLIPGRTAITLPVVEV